MKIIRSSRAETPPSRAWHGWSGSNARPVPLQLAIDAGAVLMSILIVIATAMSVPLAIFLLLFCNF